MEINVLVFLKIFFATPLILLLPHHNDTVCLTMVLPCQPEMFHMYNSTHHHVANVSQYYKAYIMANNSHCDAD